MFSDDSDIESDDETQYIETFSQTAGMCSRFSGLCQYDQICMDTKDGNYTCLTIEDENDSNEIFQPINNPNTRQNLSGYCKNFTFLCEKDQICVDTKDYYDCKCKHGYEKDLSNKCVDFDECFHGTHNCLSDKLCINTEGSFRCFSCDLGERIAIQKHELTCVIDKCYDYKCDEEEHCEIRSNEPHCMPCRKGFEKRHGNCVDRDECKSKTNVCVDNEICTNLEGSYRCQKFECGEYHYKNYKNGKR